ncbi:MAG: low molecular weight phosphotyrosine protein phosphatase [Cocleimonas sp.]|nr:low molecular weight phosphotyrosine protein phosphatase [Cocleimonas sp.]
MSIQKKIGVVFVCMGNICRSPTAEGVFRHVVNQRSMQDMIKIDSAGTHAYHIGEPPDSRSQAMAKSRGVDLSGQRAREVEAIDFERFDYVIAMDRSNYENLKDIASVEQQEKLHLFMGFTSAWDNAEVPDPYYGGGDGFKNVFDMVQSASEGLLERIVKNDL